MTEDKIKKVAVIGGGSWATALVKILSERPNISIHWWIRKKEQVEHVKKFNHNPAYLSDVTINTQVVSPSEVIKDVVRDAEIIILAIPAAFLKNALAELSAEDFKQKIVASAIKGMIPEENLLISQFLEKEYNLNSQNLLMISGPSHSEEVAMEKQSYLTIAGNDIHQASVLADCLSCRFIKTSTVADLYGVEYAAVMKNIYGIACGLARGLNYGDNFQAVLVSNAVSELNVVLNSLFPKNRNINASAYLGDLLVTGYSQFSRNRTLGNMVGRGYSVKSALVEMNMVAEGFYGVKCVYESNKNSITEMPIVKAVYNILYEKISPSIEFKILENILT